MIIEATPRPLEGLLKGCTPSLNKSERRNNLNQTRQKLYCQEVPTKNKTQVHRLERGHFSPINRCKINKPAFRRHPYSREPKAKFDHYSRNCHISSSISHQKFHSLQQGLIREKALKLRKFYYQFSGGEKESRQSRNQNLAPFFTANANENNDNCPSSAFGNNRFSISQNPTTESPINFTTEDICDIEIEDLTAEHTSSSYRREQEANPWRQRRKSFNTNPLSSSAARESYEHPPSLLSLHDFQPINSPLSSRSTKGQGTNKREGDSEFHKPNIYQILGIHPSELKTSPSNASCKERTTSFANYPTSSSFTNRVRTHSKERAISALSQAEPQNNIPSSIERLVKYFESSSTNKLDYNHNETNLELGKIQARCKRFGTPVSSQNSNKVEVSPFHHRGRDNELFEPDISSSPIDFTTNFFSDSSWDSAFTTSPEFIHNKSEYKDPRSEPHYTTRGVFNNNGNAATTTQDSRALWPGNQYGRNHFSPISCQKNRYKNSIPATSSSTIVFSSARGRSASSLSRVSSDVELIDLESTRLSSWPGSHSIPSAFDRGNYQQVECRTPNSSCADTLIDLQSTSKRTGCRTNNWFTNSDSNLARTDNHRSLEISNYPTSTSKGYSCEVPSKNSYQKSFCQAKSQTNSGQFVSSASANNHHNASSSCDYNRLPGQNSQPDRFDNLFREKLECNDRKENQFPFGDFRFHQSLLNPFLRKKSNFFESDSCDMGCIQSIAKSKVSPDRCHHGIIVEDIQADIDRTPTEIEEKSPIVLRYRTPYFRASAKVIVPPIPRKETWTVGWIQACDSMKFINQYGRLGNSSWEIPALKDRRITAVSDSDGVSYPWYGNTTEIATVEGPTDTSRSLTLRMNDNFYPSVTWDIPVSEGSEAHLTHIVRDQSFTTWLAAVNQTTGRLEVLRTVKWHFYLEIEVDPTHELGKRACIVSPLEQKQPVILKNNTEPIYISSPHRSNNTSSMGGRQKRLNRRPGAGGDNNSNNHTNFIPKSALVRPSANNAQTLIWRPTRDIPVIVVPAKEEYKENNEVVWFSRSPNMHGHDHNVRVLSMQEMTELKKSVS